MQTTQTFQQPVVQQPAVAREEKNAAVALILSLIFWGSGQVFNGETGKGFGIMICAIIGYTIFIFPGVVVVLYGMFDAYTIATKMNKGEIPYKPTNMGKVITFIITELFFIIVVALVIMGSSYHPYYYY